MLPTLRHCVTSLALTALLLPSADAQCMDWGHGFGIPGNGADRSIYCFAEFDDGTGLALYVGGDFNNIGGQAISDFARWDGANWSAVPGGVFTGDVSSLAVYDDGSGPALIASGPFTSVDGIPVSNIARWDGTTWSALGAGLSGSPKNLIVWDDGTGSALYACGGFTTWGPVTTEGIARWDGSAWSELDGGVPSGTIYDAEVHDDGTGERLYITGGFTAVGTGGLSAKRIASWDGTTWSSLGLGLVGGSPYGTSLASYDDGSGPALYVGGQFNKAGGNPAQNLAKWDAGAWSALAGDPSDLVTALGVFDGGFGAELYVGGEFLLVGALSASRMARWNGGSWASVGVGIDWSTGRDVNVLFSSSVGAPRLWAGGDFELCGDMPSMNVGTWGGPCTAPIFHSQPQDLVAAFGVPAIFSVDVQVTAPVTYQWLLDGVPVVNSAVTWGADTSTLIINAWSLSDAGVYEVVVTNALGSVTSDPATLTVPTPGLGAPVEVETLIVAPTPIPNQPGRVWTFVGAPLGSSTGEVLFYGEVDGFFGSLGLMQGGSAELIAMEFEPAPFTEAGTYFVNGPQRQDLAANGQVAFRSDLEGPAISVLNNEGIWYRDTTGMDLVARKGDPVPGLGAGATYGSFYHGPYLNDLGQVVFDCSVTVGGVYLAVYAFRWDPVNGSVVVAVSGTTAPGTTALFDSNFDVQVNDTGTILFLARLDSTSGFAPGKDYGLWLGTPGAFQLIAKGGDLAPGFASSTLGLFYGDGEMHLDAGGGVTWKAAVWDASGALGVSTFEWRNGAVGLVAKHSQPAPAGPVGATIAAPSPEAVNAQGHVVVRSSIQGSCPSCPSSALWLYENGTLTEMATNNVDPLPGAPASLTLESFDLVAMNEAKQVVWAGKLGSNASLFGWHDTSGLFPIAVPGMQLDIGGGSFRTVGAAWIFSSAGRTGSSMADDGTVYFQSNFTDGTNGIYKAHFSSFLAAHFGPTTNYCSAGSSAGGCQAILTGTGLPSASAPSGFDLIAFDVEGAKDALFFFGTNGRQANSWGNGTSFQCVGPPVMRAGLLVGSGQPGTCDGSFSQDMNARWTAKPAQNPGAGAVVQAQLWYRDPFNTSNQTTSLSDAVEFVVGP